MTLFHSLSVLFTLALAISSTSAHEPLHGRVKRQTSRGKVYKIVQNYSGSSFFKGFDFFTARDPTNGLVNYLPAKQANAQRLAYISKGNAILAVDSRANLAQGQPRNSTRITSKQTFNKGQLLILDATHAPTGCATWPAFWTVGPDWPNGGEIDIVEGVNNNAATQYTLHTANGCTLQTPMKASGQVLTTDCYAYANFNTGCGVKERRSGSFGPSFNKNGGGVFATLWTDEGIKMFFWSRKNVPKDVKAMKPNPATWGTPAAFFSTATCSASFFKPQTIVINTTLCGDWAGSPDVYGKGDGCPGTCAQRVQRGSNFREAYWSIASVRVYQ